jgi:D-alanyl-D-alanine carboxypeptidase
MMNYRKIKWLLFVLALIAAAFIFWPQAKKNNIAPAQPSKKTPAATTKTTANQTYPIDKADSLWVIVNKGRVLPSDYVPAGLRPPQIPLRLAAANPEMTLAPEAATALEEMSAAAKTGGLNLMLASGYRSYSLQVAVHDAEVRNNGAAAADAVSARPGHSEHQTGLAADLEPANRRCEVLPCFADTPEGAWLAANAYKYGFIIRYQKTTVPETGYNYEPWHVRYIGKSLAATIQSQNVTLEKYFNLTFYTDYPAQSLQLKK